MLTITRSKQYAAVAHVGGSTNASVHLQIACLVFFQLLSAACPLSAYSQPKNLWNEMIGSA